MTLTTPPTETAAAPACRLFPNWEALDHLSKPLERGERALVMLLDAKLPAEWLIFVQPYLNEMRPDVVVLNPNLGMVVIEVKDWTLGRYRHEGSVLRARTARSSWIEEDPVRKCQWYAQTILEFFLARGAAEYWPHNSSAANQLCRSCVYFHEASTREARALFAGRLRSTICLGRDALDEADVTVFVPQSAWRTNRYVREPQVAAYREMLRWLQPPKHSVAQVSKSKLTPEQARFAAPGTGFHRIRGGAGCGKSFVLAHRAARANRDGRKVLALSFNITMSHYLRDLINETPYAVDWSRITWGHYHGFAIRQGIDSGFLAARVQRESAEHGEPVATESESIDPIALLERVIEGLDLAPSYARPLYDAIYVDEAQDFHAGWLDSLVPFLAPGGELVIFADHRQNIYRQDGGRDVGKSLKRCKFRGNWGQMPAQSHRLPQKVCELLNVFAKETGLGDPEDFPIEPQARLTGLETLLWENVDSFGTALDLVEVAIAELEKRKGELISPSDIVVLLADHKSGIEAVTRLEKSYGQINHVFGQTRQESRRRKLTFWMGKGELKMSTIHSFKGWELDSVILIWLPEPDITALRNTNRSTLFYTACSRSLRNLVILNGSREYDPFGAGFESLRQLQPTVSSSVPLP